MPTPRRFDKYPKEYSELFRQARARTVTVTCKDRSAARRLRGRLYAFRKALLEEPEQDIVLALIIPLISLHIEDSNLKVYRREDDTLLLQQGLAS